MKRLSILIIVVLFWGCSKDEQVGIIPFEGNNIEIDSVVYYDGDEYSPESARKFTYSKNKDTITSSVYSESLVDGRLYLSRHTTYYIKNNKIITKGTYYNDSCVSTYFLNKKRNIEKCIIKSLNDQLFDSIVYKYDVSDQIKSVNHYKYPHSLSNVSDTFTTNYFWSNGNITKTIQSHKSSNKDLNSEYSTTYSYSYLFNPLTFNYLNNYYGAFLKFGKSTKNLPSWESEYYNSKYTNSSYIYTFHQDSSGFLTKKYGENDFVIYRIFYK